MKTNIIYNEDCLIGMKRLPDNSIDLLCCDPQYGWGFMGKSWDKAIPSVEIWKECLRVIKPGSFGFIMTGPRQDCLVRMIVSLEDAGFNVSFSSIYWAYASGFPKAQNIGKAIDKRLGAERIRVKNPVGNLKPWRDSENRIDIQETIPDNNPITFQAQALDGSYGGFQPKPAVEVVIVAMKPLSEKTYVDQALANGKGISWLGEGRIPYESKDYEKAEIKAKSFENTGGGYQTKYVGGENKKPIDRLSSLNNQGRFPANLLVSDDCLNDGKSRGVSGSAKLGKPHTGGHKSGFMVAPQTDNISPNDSGSFSRYFSLDAWWEKKLKELPEGVRKTFPFLIVPKASKAEKNRGCEGLEAKNSMSNKIGFDETKRNRQPRNCQLKNNHPTVKPLKLMSYLITLGSRQGDIVLDPFIGSGTTAIAAVMMGRHYIGYETDKDYVRIANKRLSGVQLSLL